MVITTTGIAFTLSSLGLAFCSIRFFGAFQSIGSETRLNKSGLLLSTYFLLTSMQHGIMASGSLFFANNPEALYATLVFVNLLLTLLAPFAVYLTLYILKPKFNSWALVLSALALGIYATAQTLELHPLPFMTSGHSIDWNTQPSLQIFLNLLLIVSIGTPIFLFAKILFGNFSKNVRRIFLILTFVHVAGVINVTILFGRWLFGDYDITNRIFDVILIIIGMVFVAVFLIAPLVFGLRKKRPI